MCGCVGVCVLRTKLACSWQRWEHALSYAVLVGVGLWSLARTRCFWGFGWHAESAVVPNVGGCPHLPLTSPEQTQMLTTENTFCRSCPYWTDRFNTLQSQNINRCRSLPRVNDPLPVIKSHLGSSQQFWCNVPRRSWCHTSVCQHSSSKVNDLQGSAIKQQNKTQISSNNAASEWLMQPKAPFTWDVLGKLHSSY